MILCFRRHSNLCRTRRHGILGCEEPTSIENVVIQSKTVLGKAELTIFMFKPIAIEQTWEASVLFVDRNNNINAIDFSESSSEFSSFAQNFFIFN